MTAILKPFTSRKGIAFDIFQEDCNESNKFFQERLAELNQIGNGRNTKDSLPDVHGVIWAKNGDEIASALFYDLEKSKDTDGIWIVLVYTDPKYRQQGLYNYLHQCVNAVAKELGRSKIITWFSLNNQKMFQIGKTVGYRSTMVIMEREA